MSMTLTEARSITRRVLRYGYYRDDDHQRRAYARCPYCRYNVYGTRHEAHHTDAGQTRLLLRALTAALVEHLRDDCTATP